VLLALNEFVRTRGKAGSLPVADPAEPN